MLKISAQLFLICFWIGANPLRAQDPVKSLAELQKIKDQEVRELMLSWSRQLKVTCTECHNPKNFKDSSKPSFKTALEHARIVEWLKNNGFPKPTPGQTKIPEASCSFCHHGKLKPEIPSL